MHGGAIPTYAQQAHLGMLETDLLCSAPRRLSGQGQRPAITLDRQKLRKPAHQSLLGCLQILENTAFRKLATTRSAAISLVEHRRAHNICIELSGIRMPFDAIKVSKLAYDMDNSVSGLERR